MSWQSIDTGKRTASENMELDAALLEDLESETDCLLHLYDWEADAVTYGHFIDPKNFLDMEGVKQNNLDLAKRPTGGGIIFHNCDFAFSVLVPASSTHFSHNPLDNYAFVNKRVAWAIRQLIDIPTLLLPEDPTPLDEHCKSFCMAKPTKYDVMIADKKIGGAAQRKTRDGFLHQGSISLGLLPLSYLERVLAKGTQVLGGMRQNSFSILGQDWTQKELKEARQALKDLLQIAFSEKFEES
ncbi:MAG: Octanoyltransferase LipM [Chlamydiales bacterium]|nr:Octanoyltransferase LipM [Chlamydiales bacterium]